MLGMDSCHAVWGGMLVHVDGGRRRHLGHGGRYHINIYCNRILHISIYYGLHIIDICAQ